MSQLAIKLAAMTDIRLVLLSVAISIVGSYTVLDIAAQIMLSEGQTRRWWLLGSGLALGISTWAMHFTAILSHRMTTPVSYDFRVVLLSMGVATIGAIFGLWAVTRQMTEGVSMGRRSAGWQQHCGNALCCDVIAAFGSRSAI